MSENNSPKSNSFVTEAPASWNTKYVTPDGFVCQLTLRGETGKDLLEKANAALAWLKENGYQPFESFPNRFRGNDTLSTPSENGNGNGNGHTSPSWCPIHSTEMKRWEKNGKVWFSHKVDGGWCTGKSK